jgi:hypothetical protein
MTLKLPGLELRFYVGRGRGLGFSVRLCNRLEIDVQN